MAMDNKAVIVTGAASGMGLAMTIALLTSGHDVTAVDRNGAALAELAKRAANLRGTVNPVTADLAQSDSFAHVTGSALITFGRIDALVNNAGIGQASIRPTSGRTRSASGTPRRSNGPGSSPSTPPRRSTWRAPCCRTC